MQPDKKSDKKQDKKMIYTIAAIFMIMFAVLIGYLVYFTIFKQKEMSTHSQNTRMNQLSSEVVRGDIYDHKLTLLATTDETGTRQYPYGNLYAHAVGYCQNGKTGAEALANSELLYPNYSLKSIFKMAFFNEKFHGRNVVLTIDHRYQEAAAKAMEGKKGAVVVLDVSTGQVKAMYSNPNFDPNKIEANWSALNTDEENSPLLNRATQGLYPPGSIFKVVTTLAYMNTSTTLDFEHDCDGEIKGNNYKIECFNHKAHGKLDLSQAFAKSCNTYFVALARTLPNGALEEAAQSLGFNKQMATDIGYRISKFDLTTHDTDFEKDATAIGQGRTLTNPFQMAVIAAAIANDGVSMKPYLVSYSMNENLQIKDRNLPQVGPTLMSEKKAQQLQELMEGVLDFGTAVSLPEKGLVVGGKTGTAENETKADHSWFMGYAKDPNDPSKSPIAFAVIVEGGGKGAQSLSVCDGILEAYRSIDD